MDSQSAMSLGQDEPINYATLFSYDDDPTSNFTSLDFPNLQAGAALCPSVRDITSSSSFATNVDDPGTSPDDSDSDAILKYIRQVLMEENIDHDPSMLHDPLALQATEIPFYHALGQNYPTSSDQQQSLTYQYPLNREDNFPGSPNSDSPGSHGGYKPDATQVLDVSDHEYLLVQTPPFESSSQPAVVSSVPASSASPSSVNPLTGANLGTVLGSHLFSDRESMLLFQRGMDEANKFLPKINDLFVNLDDITFPKESKEEEVVPSTVVAGTQKEDVHSGEGYRARRIHYLDDADDLEGERKSKQSALSVEETDELSELFNKVLLWKHGANCTSNADSKLVANPETFDQSFKCNGFDQQGGEVQNTVDLGTLLILCAQAVASDDLRTCNELLSRIRQHSSPTGDGSQRLAHFFADALEARLAGTGSQIYTALASKRITASDMIKAYQVSFSSFPFTKLSFVFANLSIARVAEKSNKLHIIDFGISYGFQWPALIEKLSEREGGPPELRITGIELPQRGFRPAERVKATGHWLAKYCEMFKVPFKYQAIAQKWETIKVEDLKIESDEVLAVNSIFRLGNLLDETIVADSPRDAVLKLIKDMKPCIFVHAIINGSFNAPFFITRFREAVFHYSTLFDMVDTNVSRENLERAKHERDFFGREIMNVVACEGTERVERPETYKQWKVRTTRAGFRQLRLDPGMMKVMREKLKKLYHKDFSIDEDWNWALQGWKGRIAVGISAWEPS